MMLTVAAAWADDNQARAVFDEGKQLETAGQPYAAAQKFADAELLADSAVLKANALKAQIAAYKASDMYFREFEAIEQLLSRFPEEADYAAMVNREYELGELYYNGKREPAFWSLRWIPWLHGADKSKEIFEKALERAPFSKRAPSARLRLAYILDQESKVKESLDQLRLIIKNYPDSTEVEFAYLALADGLLVMAQRGDGDGKYSSEAIEVFHEIIKKYPKSEHSEWARKSLLKAQDIQAERLLTMAKFYERTGRTDASERYLARIVKDFPESKQADQSENMLANLDKTYLPDGYRPEVEERLIPYEMYAIPREAKKLLVVPEASNGKYLLPVYDLNLNKKQ